MEISAKTKEMTAAVTIEYDMPTTLDGLVEKFGADVVGSAAQGALIISLQAAMRRMIEKEKPQAEIQSTLAGWRPDVRSVVKQTAFEKVTSSLDKLSPDERKSLLAKLKADLAGG